MRKLFRQRPLLTCLPKGQLYLHMYQRQAEEGVREPVRYCRLECICTSIHPARFTQNLPNSGHTPGELYTSGDEWELQRQKVHTLKGFGLYCTYVSRQRYVMSTDDFSLMNISWRPKCVLRLLAPPLKLCGKIATGNPLPPPPPSPPPQ